MDKGNTWYGPAHYQIKVKGRLSRDWNQLSEDIDFTYEEGITTVTTTVPDQSALHGLLNRIRDLGVQLITIQRLPQNQNY